MKHIKNCLVTLLVLLAMITLSGTIAFSGDKSDESEANLAPDFELNNLSGETVRLSDYRGKIVVLNFWSPDCGYCKAEMPDMEAFFQEYKEKDIVVLTISLSQGSKETIEEFMTARGFSFPVLLDNAGQTSKLYRIQNVPCTFIIGKDGEALRKIDGMFNFMRPDFRIDGLSADEIRELEMEDSMEDYLHSTKRLLAVMLEDEDAETIARYYLVIHAFLLADDDGDLELNQEEMSAFQEINVQFRVLVERLSYEAFEVLVEGSSNEALARFVLGNMEKMTVNDMVDVKLLERKAYLTLWPATNKELEDKIATMTDQARILSATAQLEKSRAGFSKFIRNLAFYVADRDDNMKVTPGEYAPLAELFQLPVIKQPFLVQKEFVESLESCDIEKLTEYVKRNFKYFTRSDIVKD